MNINENVSMIFFSKQNHQCTRTTQKNAFRLDCIYRIKCMLYLCNVSLANSYAIQFRKYFTRNPKTKLKKTFACFDH